MFAPEGDGVRARLGSDVWRVVLSVLGLAVTFFAYRQNARLQVWFVNQTVPAPPGIAWLLTILAIAGTYGAVGLLLLTSLLSRRRPVLIDVLGSGVLAIALVGASRWLLGVTAGATFAGYTGVNTGIPVPVLTVTVAMALAARPYLSRTFQRLCYLGFTLGAVCTVADAKGLPLSVAASLLIGWGSAATIRLITGTPSGLPGADAISSLLEDLGVHVRSVAPTVRQNWGAARYDAVDAAGSSLRVSLYGRDARDAELVAAIGRSIAYRDVGASLFVSRLQQAEHEAYVTLRASSALDGRAPEVVAAGQAGPSRDGVVVTRRPAGSTLAALQAAGTSPPAGTAAKVLDAVGTLGARSLSHGSIDLDHVVVQPDGTVVIDDYLRGTSAASPQRVSRDFASALVCAALLDGTAGALDAAVAAVGTDRLAAALPFLQGAALPSPLASVVKAHPELLEQLRTEGAARLGVDAPELAKLTRVSITTIVLILGTLIGGWALIAVFINVANTFSTIRGANLLWVSVVAILSACCYPMSAMSCEGSIPATLPYPRLVELEFSNTFSGLAAGTVAVLAARVRFFQKQGLDATSAVSSGVIVSTASWIVKGALFLIALPFAWSTFHLNLAEQASGSHQRLVQLVLFVVVVVLVAAGVALALPRMRSAIRKKLAPKAAEVRTHLVVLAQRPIKLFEVFGGQVAVQLLVAFALGASLHAFGAHLSIAQLLIVLTIGSMLGGVSPVPGGMGVVEAGMILGLTAVGIPENIAVSAVFIQRLFTAYLPPVGGWFALMSLRRHDYL